MKTTLTAVAAVITALTLTLLPACASHEEAPDPIKVQEEIAEYRDQELELVRTTVLDDQRADQLIQLIGKRDLLISGYVQEIQTYRKKMAELNADYDAERKSFDELMSNYNIRRSAAQQELIDLIADMKMATTPEEWKAISKFQLKRLNPRTLVYGQAQAGD
jgi:hypothetical protein